MDKAHLEKTLTKLLIQKDRAIIASISGDWGVGKTYFWKNFAKNRLIGKKTFVHISLFGKEHYKDILEEIVFKLFDKDNQKAQKFALLTSKIIKVISNVLSNGAINLNPNPQTIFSLLKKDDFSNIVICFDDIERLSQKLDIRDFLGLLSQLKEDKDCKVVLLLNQNQLSTSNAKDFDKFAEKTIDINLKYKPSIEDSFEIANKVVKNDICKATFEIFDKEIILESFRNINLDNIRIMIYILLALSDFAEELQNFDELNEDFTNNLLGAIIENLVYLKVFGEGDIGLDISKYIALSNKKPYNSTLENMSGDRNKDEEKEYEEINQKYPNVVKYKSILSAAQYPNEFTEIVKFYYKHSYISQADIAYLKNFNLNKNIDKTTEKFFSSVDFYNYHKPYDEIIKEVCQNFEKMLSYREYAYFFEKIASYREWISSVENIVKRLQLDSMYPSINFNDFYKNIFDSLRSSKLNLSDEDRESIEFGIITNHFQNEKYLQYKKELDKYVCLSVKDILRNKMNDDEKEHLRKIESITKEAIKDFIKTDKNGLMIVLRADTTSERFQKNKNNALEELKLENTDLEKKLKVIEEFDKAYIANRQ